MRGGSEGAVKRGRDSAAQNNSQAAHCMSPNAQAQRCPHPPNISCVSLMPPIRLPPTSTRSAGRDSGRCVDQRATTDNPHTASCTPPATAPHPQRQQHTPHRHYHSSQ